METEGDTVYTNEDKNFCFSSNDNFKVAKDSGYDSLSFSKSEDGESESEERMEEPEKEESVHVGIEEGFVSIDNLKDKEYLTSISSTSTESECKTSATLEKPLFSSKEEFFETYFALDQDGDSFFLIDLLNSRTEKIKRVLELQPPSSYLNKQNDFQLTALHLAVMTQQPWMLEILLRYGADVEIVTDQGYNVWHIAAEKSNPTMLKVLAILYKANVLPKIVVGGLSTILHSKCYGGMSPIHIAIRKRRSENVSLLLDIGADPNDKDHLFEATPLHYAAEMGAPQLVTELIHNRNAVINPRTRDGSTPLHVAVSSAQAAVVAILLGAGASLEDENCEGDTAKSLATDERVLKVVKNMSTPLFPTYMAKVDG